MSQYMDGSDEEIQQGIKCGSCVGGGLLILGFIGLLIELIFHPSWY